MHARPPRSTRCVSDAAWCCVLRHADGLHRLHTRVDGQGQLTHQSSDLESIQLTAVIGKPVSRLSTTVVARLSCRVQSLYGYQRNTPQYRSVACHPHCSTAVYVLVCVLVFVSPFTHLL